MNMLNILIFFVTEIRQSLYEGLQQRNVPGSWEHIIDQRGMFSYTGIVKHDCEALREDYHIYMLSDGRISLAGVFAYILICLSVPFLLKLFAAHDYSILQA